MIAPVVEMCLCTWRFIQVQTTSINRFNAYDVLCRITINWAFFIMLVPVATWFVLVEILLEPKFVKQSCLILDSKLVTQSNFFQLFSWLTQSYSQFSQFFNSHSLILICKDFFKLSLLFLYESSLTSFHGITKRNPLSERIIIQENPYAFDINAFTIVLPRNCAILFALPSFPFDICCTDV